LEQRQTKRIVTRIRMIKKAAQELRALSAEIPAIDRNVERILASVKMLEINLSDLLDLRTRRNTQSRPFRMRGPQKT
jgi:hypothetical protein